MATNPASSCAICMLAYIYVCESISLISVGSFALVYKELLQRKKPNNFPILVCLRDAGKEVSFSSL
jgi:hypothetical protein